MGKDKETFEPKIKADEQVEYEGADKPESFTAFEELMKKVEVMKEVIDEHAEILRDNSLVRTKEIEAPYVDDDEIYKRLENDE